MGQIGLPVSRNATMLQPNDNLLDGSVSTEDIHTLRVRTEIRHVQTDILLSHPARTALCSATYVALLHISAVCE